MGEDRTPNFEAKNEAGATPAESGQRIAEREERGRVYRRGTEKKRSAGKG